ncbi:MAG TPA: hypothetical protein VEV15_11300, partial [Flavisolibacter sp.]|nr:hypothetical protein [Flavisolibacter sp.]
LIGGLLFFASCNNSADTKTNNADTAAVETEETSSVSVNEEFPRLFTYLQSQDSSFSPDKFEGGEMDLKDSLPKAKIDTAQLRPFRPYLIYNRDSSMAIDLVSYNYVISHKKGKTVIQQGGPDTEVALLDLKNNTRKRILFLGSAGTVLQAKWNDDNSIAIVGAEEVEGGKIKPSIWNYDWTTGKMELYQYPDAIHANIKDYTEQGLNKQY